jgi:hypothetical protein
VHRVWSHDSCCCVVLAMFCLFLNTTLIRHIIGKTGPQPSSLIRTAAVATSEPSPRIARGQLSRPLPRDIMVMPQESTGRDFGTPRCASIDNYDACSPKHLLHRSQHVPSLSGRTQFAAGTTAASKHCMLWAHLLWAATPLRPRKYCMLCIMCPLWARLRLGPQTASFARISGPHPGRLLCKNLGFLTGSRPPRIVY